MRKAVKATCEDAIEGIHENFYCVLHRIVKFNGDGSIFTLCFFECCFVFISLSHEVLQKRRDHPFASRCRTEHCTCRCFMKGFTFNRLIGLGRVNACRVANVTSDHDRGIHALEIQHCNPRMEPCFDIVNIASRNLSHLGLSRTRERDGHLLLVCQADDQGINELACTPVRCCFKRDFGHRCNGFFSRDCLNCLEDVKRQGRISFTIGHHLIGSRGPFLIHIGSINIHLVFVFIIGEKQRGDK